MCFKVLFTVFYVIGILSKVTTYFPINKALRRGFPVTFPLKNRTGVQQFENQLIKAPLRKHVRKKPSKGGGTRPLRPNRASFLSNVAYTRSVKRPGPAIPAESQAPAERIVNGCGRANGPAPRPGRSPAQPGNPARGRSGETRWRHAYAAHGIHTPRRSGSSGNSTPPS